MQDLVQSRKQPRPHPRRSIKPKKHQITYVLQDPLEERKRRDAIRMKTNRDKRKTKREEMICKVVAMAEQYNEILAKVRALRKRKAELTRTLERH